jgi:hypothetical protein
MSGDSGTDVPDTRVTAWKAKTHHEKFCAHNEWIVGKTLPDIVERILVNGTPTIEMARVLNHR